IWHDTKEATTVVDYPASGGMIILRFLRDVVAIGIGVFLGFVAIVNTHELVDVVYAFSQLQRLELFSFLSL
ncbi:MAG: hypothetical protein VXA68_07510, partial [Gammaproteobacteria bacterium]